MIYLALFTILFLAARLVVTTINYFDRPQLPVSKAKHENFISILVPARNEAENLPKLFESLEKQTFSNYELLILNDVSADGTFFIAQQYSKNNSKCKVFNSAALPPGWLGKNWACHQLSLHANAEFLFFLDADVIVKNNFFESVLTEMKNKKISLLSVFPHQEMETWGEKMVVPLMNFILLTLIRLKWVYTLPYSSLSAANGQCMVFEKNIYRHFAFHSQARAAITEDIEIMKLVKKQKLKVAVYLGNKLINCRMYKSFNNAVDGFSKNFISGFGNVFFAFFYVASISLFYFSFFGHGLILIFSVVSIFIILLIRIMVSAMSGQNIFLNILLHPLQILTMVTVFMQSVYLKISGKNQWKGRKIG